MNLNQGVSDYIHSATKEQAEIMEILRNLIHESVDGVSEAIKWNIPVFGATKDFTYLRYAKNHITLGFYNFEKIVDQADLLLGEGNTMKHIKIKKKEEINTELLSTWFKAISS